MMDITLALGGGGVKGHAHLGVLRVLDQTGFRIAAIAGTSAGGMTGALYAAGYKPQEIEDRMAVVNPEMLYTRSPHDAPALLGLNGVMGLLEEMLGERTFADLQIPFAVTATCLDTARPLALNRGRVLDALAATIAVPGIFPAQMRNGRLLVDGGVLDPVPVTLARQLAPGLPVAAVALSPQIDGFSSPQRPSLLNALPILSRYLGRLRLVQALDVFMRAVDVGGIALTELRMVADPPDVVIRPNIPLIGLLDPVDVHDVALMGAQAAVQALPELRRAAGWQGRLRRAVSPNGRSHAAILEYEWVE